MFHVADGGTFGDKLLPTLITLHKLIARRRHSRGFCISPPRRTIKTNGGGKAGAGRVIQNSSTHATSNTYSHAAKRNISDNITQPSFQLYRKSITAFFEVVKLQSRCDAELAGQFTQPHSGQFTWEYCKSGDLGRYAEQE